MKTKVHQNSVSGRRERHLTFEEKERERFLLINYFSKLSLKGKNKTSFKKKFFLIFILLCLLNNGSQVNKKKKKNNKDNK